MQFINIRNMYGCSLQVGGTAATDLPQAFQRFVQAVEERNERMKALLQQLAEALETEEKKLLLAELSECQQASEQDLEQYKKLTWP